MMILYRIYQLFIVMPLCIVCSIIISLITIIGCALGDGHFWGYYPGKFWGWFFCRILLLPVKIEGREKVDKNISYVFVANHQGSFDIFLIYGFLGRNFKWMMKKSLMKMPFVGAACKSAHHIFVDKSGPSKVKKTIKNAYHTLQNGTSLVVFPEGARTFTGHMGIFRRGAFQLASELNLSVVPITINGSFNILPRMKGFNFVNHHELSMIIHEPIPTKGRDVTEVMKEAYNIMMNGLPEEYQGFIKNDDQ
jgi:1-acyl-sn-glycerol-3-phosphate acyltransferase